MQWEDLVHSPTCHVVRGSGAFSHHLQETCRVLRGSGAFSHHLQETCRVVRGSGAFSYHLQETCHVVRGSGAFSHHLQETCRVVRGSGAFSHHLQETDHLVIGSFVLLFDADDCVSLASSWRLWCVWQSRAQFFSDNNNNNGKLPENSCLPSTLLVPTLQVLADQNRLHVHVQAGSGSERQQRTRVEWRLRWKPGAVGCGCALWRHSGDDCGGSDLAHASAPLLVRRPPCPPDAHAHLPQITLVHQPEVGTMGHAWCAHVTANWTSERRSVTLVKHIQQNISNSTIIKIMINQG